MVERLGEFAGLVLFWAGFAGYALLLHVKTRLPADLIPAVLFGGVITALYAASLAGLLLPGAIAIQAAGTAALVVVLAPAIKRKTLAATLKGFLSPGFLLFLGLSFFFLVYMRGARMMVGDNFSHWGLMAEYLHRNNALPAHTVMIGYQSYPPGSALFIYLATLLSGYAESRMMWAQMLLMLAGVAALFAVLRGKKAVPMALAALGGFVMLACGISSFDLLVDAVYPMVGLGATLVVLHYRRDLPRAAVFSTPLSVACTLIKNSGVLLAVINSLLICYFAWRNHRLQRREGGEGQAPATGGEKKQAVLRRVAVAVAVLLPFVVLLSWNLHVDRAFPEGESTKHAMRAENIGQGLSEKTDDVVKAIVQVFWRTTLRADNVRLWDLLVWNIAALIMAMLCFKKRRGQTLGFVKGLIFADGVFAVYMASLLAMYLTTMPTDEALEMASYHRYLTSIHIYLVGVLVWVALDFWQDALEKRERLILAGLLALALAHGALRTASIKNTFQKREYHGTLFEVIDNETAFLEDRTDKYTYFVIGPKDIQGGNVQANTGGYIRYRLWSTNYDVQTPEYIEQNLDWFLKEQNKYTMLIILEDSPFIDEFMQGYPQYAGQESYVGVYNLPLW